MPTEGVIKKTTQKGVASYSVKGRKKSKHTKLVTSPKKTARSFHLQIPMPQNVAIKATELFENYHLTRERLAELANIPLQTLSRPKRLEKSIKAQNQLRDLGIILHRVEPWAGSADQAYAWFVGEPIPAFGDRTPKQVFGDQDGPTIINRYLDIVANGGYA